MPYQHIPALQTEAIYKPGSHLFICNLISLQVTESGSFLQLHPAMCPRLKFLKANPLWSQSTGESSVTVRCMWLKKTSEGFFFYFLSDLGTYGNNLFLSASSQLKRRAPGAFLVEARHFQLCLFVLCLNPTLGDDENGNEAEFAFRDEQRIV